MASPSDIAPRPFNSPTDFKDFRCEKQGYVDFVCKSEEALKHQQQNLGATYVFWLGTKPVGYVTLATGSLRKTVLPEDRKQAKPHKHVPCLLLAQMARDSTYKGKGVGKIMIDFTITKAYEIAQHVGCRYVILDAELDKIDVYKKYHFAEIPGNQGDLTRLMFFDLGHKS